MPRKFDVKGTREYLYWSVGLALLTLWAVRDGWAGYWAEIGLRSLVANVVDKYPDYPGDSFYIFNRVLTFLAGIGSIVCGVIHRMVR
ncbi:MAG TPA: hypothetical protein PKE26_07445 [Kiritimatiellia bacterium]|nr:hypothetical protein [Kiritimatiellia bacterium]HMO98926.1 hypothetical protein [Kiritimatiellia bacterium]HMP95741.1 hypothetical protein [Kiritimatiellia bacterium]